MEVKGGPRVVRAVGADVRLAIPEARQAGERAAEVAERFAVSPAFVRRLEQRFRLTGSLAPKPHAGGPALKLAAHQDALRRAARERPDATPAEHKDRLNLPASRVTVWRTLRRLRISRKKKSTRAAERDRPDVAEARRRWPRKLAGIKPEDLVFLDETGADTAMRRTHGYAPIRERGAPPPPPAGCRAPPSP